MPVESWQAIVKLIRWEPPERRYHSVAFYVDHEELEEIADWSSADPYDVLDWQKEILEDEEVVPLLVGHPAYSFISQLELWSMNNTMGRWALRCLPNSHIRSVRINCSWGVEGHLAETLALDTIRLRELKIVHRQCSSENLVLLSCTIGRVSRSSCLRRVFFTLRPSEIDAFVAALTDPAAKHRLTNLTCAIGSTTR